MEIETCKLCVNKFGEQDLTRPRVLPCGHTYCTSCLKKLIKDGKLKCPRCQRENVAKNVDNFSINFDLEEMICETKPRESDTGARGTMKMDVIMDKQIEYMDSLIITTEEMESQMEKYSKFLLEKGKENDEVIANIRKLLNLHEGLVNVINKEFNDVSQTKTAGSDHKWEAMSKVEKMDSSKGTLEAITSLAKLVDKSTEVEEWIQSCRNRYPHPQMPLLKELFKVSDHFVSTALVFADTKPKTNEILDCDKTIMEKVTLQKSFNLFQESGLNMNLEKLKLLIDADLVYSTQSRSGRLAKISRTSNKIYLHYLENKTSIPKGWSLEHSNLLSILGHNSGIAFLDIGLNGIFQERIHIDLSPDTSLARQFRMLCTGEGGQNYANTKFLNITNKGRLNEWINGGDYQNNNGSGGVSIIPGIQTRDILYNRPWVAGNVFANYSEKTALFSITCYRMEYHETQGTFGKVVNGLETIQKLAKLDDIRAAEILDCGVVLPI